jgi:ketosteroid isomerase-like protein
MSEENVEIVRALYEMGDFFNATPEQFDRAFRDYLDEQFELRLPPDYPEGKLVFRGRQGAGELIAMLHDTWGEWSFETERFIDANDRVVVFARILAKGGGSGVPVELQTTHVWTVGAGRATSVQFYRDRSEALEAAGLSE